MSDQVPAVAEDGDASADGAGCERGHDDALTAVRFVGPATAATLDDSDVDAAAIRARRVSYRQLSEAGVNPGVAARLRREHSLPWSFDAESEDLGRRSAQIRGLGEAERAWVAASSGEWDESEGPASTSQNAEASVGDWTPGGWPGQDEADGSGDSAAAETAWREWSEPEPVTTLTGVGDASAERLAEAGVTSVRCLATVDPARVAAALGISAGRVRAWHATAREHVR